MTDRKSPANPLPNASKNATADTFFSIKFGAKPSEEQQNLAIAAVKTYQSARQWHFVVQHESNSQNEWCINVFVRPDEHGAFKRDSIAKSYGNLMMSRAKFSKENFRVFKKDCDPSQSRVLDQNVCYDQCVESIKLNSCISPATTSASGTNSGIQNSGYYCTSKNPHHASFLPGSCTANDADPVLLQAVILMTWSCRLAEADHTKLSRNQKDGSRKCIQHARLQFA